MLNKADDFIAPLCKDVIEILYQDDAILLINKPSGLLSLSGKNPANKDSVHYRLLQEFPSALLVHRLDLGTSGLMLIALSKEVVKLLNQQFSNRTVNKTYEAILDGIVEEDFGIIDLPIAKGEFPLQKICNGTGKASISEFEVIKRFSDRTFVKFTPKTGRTHQLRIHSASFSHPILGCDLYGSAQSKDKSSRLMLHACRLEFDHPISGKRITVSNPAPFG